MPSIVLVRSCMYSRSRGVRTDPIDRPKKAARKVKSTTGVHCRLFYDERWVSDSTTSLVWCLIRGGRVLDFFSLQFINYFVMHLLFSNNCIKSCAVRVGPVEPNLHRWLWTTHYHENPHILLLSYHQTHPLQDFLEETPIIFGHLQ